MEWWSRYGSFRAGSYGLPHMGDVITHYSLKRGFLSQEAFSQAAGVHKHTIDYWETSMFLKDTERRIFLAKLLRIPSDLLGLSIYSVLDNNYVIEDYTQSLKRMTELAEEDSYYAYEDILVLGWECLRKGGIPEIAERVNRRLKKLQGIVAVCHAQEKEAWQTLLFQYYRLSEAFRRHTLDDPFSNINAAITLAEGLEDRELIATSFLHRAHLSVALNKIEGAKTDIDQALTYTNSIHAPLKGCIYLVAAEINSHLRGDKQIREANKKLHGEAAKLAYDQTDVKTYDRTFSVLNKSGVHHERAKTLIKLHEFDPTNPQHLKDAESELQFARKTFTPDLIEWQLFFALTEARLRKAQEEIEESARMGKEALKIARLLSSQSGIQDVTDLYIVLRKDNPNKMEVINLGVELGIF